MNCWTKYFTFICFLVASQLSILTAQNDSLEKAFVVKMDGLLKYAAHKLESGLDIDDPIPLTVVLEILKKEIPDLIVAELENPELSFKQQLTDDDKELITTGIKAISKSLAQDQYDEHRLITISLRKVLKNILSKENDNLLYLLIGKRSSGFGQYLHISRKNFGRDAETDAELFELLVMQAILESLFQDNS